MSSAAWKCRRCRRRSCGYGRVTNRARADVMKRWTVAIALLGGLGSTIAFAQGGGSSWWSPGRGTTIPALALYDNDGGAVGVLMASGPVVTKGHPFFEAIGTNGRACVTCHQPADGMALAVSTVRARWQATRGRDPLFAPVDGMNCPDLPPDEPRSHSLLLDRG